VISAVEHLVVAQWYPGICRLPAPRPQRCQHESTHTSMGVSLGRKPSTSNSTLFCLHTQLHKLCSTHLTAIKDNTKSHIFYLGFFFSNKRKPTLIKIICLIASHFSAF